MKILNLWTFLIDLLDPNNTLSQFITSVNVPNAKYEEVEFNFKKISCCW
jgi:hypothetical protein